MNNTRWFSVLMGLFCLVAQPAFAEYKQALPGYQYAFPRDHAAHKAYKTEWWYYTGHLQSETGRPFGYELTFFRIGSDLASMAKQPDNNWALKEVYMVHLAVSDIENKTFYHTQEFGRPGGGLSGASEDSYRVWIQTWSVGAKDGKHLLKASSDNMAIDLVLDEGKVPVVHGKSGVSQKASCKGCASHYYSLTRMPTHGWVRVKDQKMKVTGQTWMDHEFGSNQLASSQVGWDWFSIQLDNQNELMLYVLRDKNGRWDTNSSGTWVTASGSGEYVSGHQFKIKPQKSWVSPQSKGTYPMGWQVSVPGKDLELTITPAFEGQELFADPEQPWQGGVSYWEGACQVKGTQKGKPVTGKAYVEMTGYDRPFDKKL